ncbi:MAG TPA: hypothetical protein VK668_09605 [Mucilaginibacter sp.]|nr:hypothetical protein [Mucilaginibacter sp.]
MKISGISLLITISLVLLFDRSFAQKSIYNYVITNNNDTIRCEMRTTLFGAIKYQAITSTGKFIKVTTKEIKEYYTAKDSSTYVVVTLPEQDSPEYLKLLERGKISFYEKLIVSYSQYGNNRSYYWYVSKDGGPLKEIKSNTIFTDGSRKERREYLANLMAEDKALVDEFKNESDFSLKKLTYFIHKYNTDQANNSGTGSK